MNDNFYYQNKLDKNDFPNKNYLNSMINKINLKGLVKTCVWYSRLYIMIWLILFIIVIALVISTLVWGSAYNSINMPLLSRPVFEMGFFNNSLLSFTVLGVYHSLSFMLMILCIPIGIFLFVLGLFLIFKTILLEKQYSNLVKKNLFFWFLVGLILCGIPSIIGSILTIIRCNEIKKQNFNVFELIDNGKYLNENYSIINKDKNNLKLIKICRGYSIAYIIVWLLLILSIVIYAGVSNNFSLNFFYTDLNLFGGFAALIFLIIELSLGLILFVLGIVLIDKTILIKNFYFHNFFSGLSTWFFIGLFLCGIPSFFTAICCIVNIKKIKNSYFYKPNSIKQKKLGITFLGISSVVSVIGVGLIGGTYISYNNYQLLSYAQYIIHDDEALSSSGYNLNDSIAIYIDDLLSEADFGEYMGNNNVITFGGLEGLFSSYGIILGWLTNDKNDGIIDFLTTKSSDSSLSTNDANLVNQTINSLNNLKNNISKGFPNASDILYVLNTIVKVYSIFSPFIMLNEIGYKNDNLAKELTNALTAYDGPSGLLTTIETIDSDLSQLIKDNVIDLSGSSTMDSTTRQYFLYYINCLGTNSAKAVNANARPSLFVPTFNNTNDIDAIITQYGGDEGEPISLNDLSYYLQSDLSSQISTQNYFENIFTLYQFLNGSSSANSYNFAISEISPEGWNNEIVNLSSFGKASINNFLQNQKNEFYNLYPSWNGNWENVIKTYYSPAYYANWNPKSTYYLQESLYHLNPYYNADQNGVIIGSTLMAIGLVVLSISIVSLVMLKKNKKNK